MRHINIIIQNGIILPFFMLLVSCSPSSSQSDCFTFNELRNDYFKNINKEFINGSNIKIKINDSLTIENLFYLGKIWGFLKYNHPVVNSGYYQWDYELFKIIPKLVNRTKGDRNKIFLDWLNGIENFEGQQTDGYLDPETVKVFPDTSWIFNKNELGEELSKKLVAIKNSCCCGSNYYVKLDESVGNPLFNEVNYFQSCYQDVGYRILTLFRYWNIIQYYYPYKYTFTENWDNVLKKFLVEFINSNDILEYKLTLSSLIQHISDSHARLRNDDTTLFNYWGKNFVPVKTRFVQDKLVVVSHYDLVDGDSYELKVGDIIDEIDGLKTDSIFAIKKKYFSASNVWSLQHILSGEFLRTNKSTLQLKVVRNSESKTVSVKCFETYSYAQSVLRWKVQDTCFKLINSNIAYLHLGTLSSNYFAELIPKILKTKGLIIDLRQYPKEFFVYSLGEYFVEKPTTFAKYTIGSITKPGLFNFSGTLEVGNNSSQIYKGKIVILVDEGSQSQAEFTAMAFRVASNAVIVGGATAGSDGNVSFIPLPDGTNTIITGIGIYYPDGAETERIGIVPNIKVRPTVVGIVNGRDELVEKAIEVINASK